jgi:DNA-directed RNA polymerase sigma subunit (sigma70/sigma32)
MRAKRLTIPQKQEIFHSLVTTQDLVSNVRKSYEIVTEKFQISEEQLKQIEDEGLDKEWPPLSEAVQPLG